MSATTIGIDLADPAIGGMHASTPEVDLPHSLVAAPAYFNRALTETSGGRSRAAEDHLHELVDAALAAYGLRSHGRNTVLVFHLGARTADIPLADAPRGQPEAAAAHPLAAALLAQRQCMGRARDCLR